MNLREAIDYYHSLLTDEMGRDSQAQIDSQLHKRGLFFGDRPLCTVLRPRFVTRGQYRLMHTAIRPILSAFAKSLAAAVANPKIMAQFGLMDWEHELVQFDPGFRAASPTARLDTFFLPDTNQLFITEYNAETPAAPAYNDVLSEAFLAVPVMGAFQKKYEVQPLLARHHMLHVMLDAYHQWGGTKRPTISILDWHNVPTYSEFVLFQDYFQRQGYDCIITDPREVDYKDGKLYAKNQQIDIIYKRVLISELVQQGGLDHPVIRAVLDRAVCMVNSFRCKVLYKKASLAVLSDEVNATLFNKAEHQAIHTHVPWTRVVAERATIHNGVPIDLVPYVQQRKDNFVLKPNDDYGGRGIILGWEASQSVWEAGIQTALKQPTVVQERIPLPWEPYPSLIDGKVATTDRMFDTAPFVWDGTYVSGCLTRISTDPLLNVTAGSGSTVPTFIVEERD
jgi:hypothetical protein